MPGCSSTPPSSAGAPSRPEGVPEAFLVVEKVGYSFGKVEAVREASLSAQPGTILGLIGSDGAGKSTLLRMTSTMLRPASGRITVGGLDAVRQKALVKPLLGYMPQRFGLWQDLTVEENFDFFLDIFGIRGQERQARKALYLGFSNLLPFLARPAGNLSGGMKQKLGLACVLAHEPKLLILDEPTNGVDPVSRREFWEILGRMRSQGMTIVVSTAYLDEGELCDRLAVMHRGVILKQGTPDEVRSSFGTLEEAVVEYIKEVDGELAADTFRTA